MEENRNASRKRPNNQFSKMGYEELMENHQYLMEEMLLRGIQNPPGSSTGVENDIQSHVFKRVKTEVVEEVEEEYPVRLNEKNPGIRFDLQTESFDLNEQLPMSSNYQDTSAAARMVNMLNGVSDQNGKLIKKQTVDSVENRNRNGTFKKVQCCKKCGRKFSNGKILTKHAASCSGEGSVVDRMLICSKCSKQYTTEKKFDKHVEHCTAMNPHDIKVEVHEQVYEQDERRKPSEEMEEEEVENEVPQKKDAVRMVLRQNIQTEEGLQISNAKPLPEVPEETDNEEEDPEAGDVGEEQEVPNTVNSAEYEEGDVSCPICNRFITSKRIFAKHVKVCGTRKKCLTCKEMFDTEELLELHQCEGYDDDSMFKCPKCYRTFKSKQSRSCHMHYCLEKSIENVAEKKRKNDFDGLESKEFECAHCGRLFKSEQAKSCHRRYCLKTPRDDMVQKEKVVVEKKKAVANCELDVEKTPTCTCGLQFPDVPKLLRHRKNVHGISAMLTCVVCNEKYNSSSTITRHTNKAFKVYLCGFCKKNCMSKSVLKTHKCRPEQTHN